MNSSKKIYQTAIKIIPAGVNSPVRAFRAVGGNPVFVKKGSGPFIWDESGKRYLDYCGSWGALFFGHAPAGLLKNLLREMKKGLSFGIATRREVEAAQAIQSFYPSMQMLRLVSSGTEAVMSAVRLARGFTGREIIVKIDGGYHGHVDSLLVKAGSGGATFGIPDSAGVPAALAGLTLSVPFNDIEALEAVFKKHGHEIAAFILEPVPANMGVVLPKPGYLEACRKITQQHGALLIFDEVISGFRVSPGGAQEIFKITPDLTCLGKILGGGLPLAAFGGRRNIMEKLAPLGPVYQAGTLSGNPLAVTAALWVLSSFKKKTASGNVNQSLHKKIQFFYEALAGEIKKRSLPVRLNALGSMFTLFFTADPVIDYASAKKSDTARFAAFFQNCLKAGIYLSPAQFEADFISTAHTDSLLEQTITCFKKSFR